jgi:2-oxoglutarate/2-oxoacid ferredoxin oxidoreductase subunit alpha
VARPDARAAATHDALTMTRKLTQGNEAVFRGAIAAGASYYAGYPISPSTEILNIASGYAAEHPEFRFLQAEDEIASANAVIGASLAGAKAFTATSGPGFSLMQEAIGYAQKVGVPSVFVNVQRVGPATGMPTMPGQGDVMQVKWGSTGDYTPIAFYPNGVEEAFRVTVEAFNAAEESRSPVVVLSDTFVAHLNEVVDLDEIARDVPAVNREMPPLGEFTDRPRFFAGVLMYEHGPNEGEPATADADEYMRQFYAAKHRHLEVASRHARFEHGWTVDAEVLVVCYGIVSRVAAPLRDEFALFRPIRIHPVLGDELRSICDRYREVVVVEANDGQYADMVELAIHREVKRVPLLGGRISLEAVREGIDRVLAGGPSQPPIPPEPTERGPRAPLGVG